MITPLNRAAVIVTPTQAFLDMVAKLMGEEPEKAATPFAYDESTVYLIDESALDAPEARKRLASCFRDIFYEEINAWFTDDSKWPRNLTWKEFESYFHISFQSMVLDTLDEEIEYEE